MIERQHTERFANGFMLGFEFGFGHTEKHAEAEATGGTDQDADDDHDGVANDQDKCPDKPETINGFQDEDGCPDEGPVKIVRQSGRLMVMDKIGVGTASAGIPAESYGILNQLAQLLKASRDIKHLRIEGHTDTQGPAAYNKHLSELRAKSVRNFLIERGVSPDRLTAVGYGEEKPMVDEKDDASKQQNRRVDFIIEQ